MHYLGTLLPVALVALAWTAAAAAADEKSAEETLKSKGLRRLSTSFALPEEAEFTKKLHEADLLKKKVRDAQKEQDAWEKKADEKQKLTVTYLQKRRELRAQLPAAPNPQVYNQIVAAINELGDRLQLLEQDEKTEQSLRAARNAALKACEEYTEHLLGIRKLFDLAKDKYEGLAADPVVTKAVAEYCQATGKTYKLGPMAGFLAAGRRLTRLEETVLSETIEIRPSAGGVWHVAVSINGKPVPEMSIDTGSTIVCLPWKIAQAVGMEPKSDAQTIELHLADGRTVEAKQVTAESVRVGKFTVENVPCAVFGQDLTKTEPMLGLSFLRHFTYKIDTANAKLIMSKVEVAEGSLRTYPGGPK